MGTKSITTYYVMCKTKECTKRITIARSSQLDQPATKTCPAGHENEYTGKDILQTTTEAKIG